MNELIAKGFRKVSHEGGIYVSGVFFNPITNEVTSRRLRDYDYADGSRDDDELYYMPIDEEALKAYRRFCGVISVGDTVEVIKGRKVPIGTIATVKAIHDYRDCYGRWVATYAYFTDGQKTNVDNCKLI